MKELTLTKKALLKGNSAAIDPRDQLPSRSVAAWHSAERVRWGSLPVPTTPDLTDGVIKKHAH